MSEVALGLEAHATALFAFGARSFFLRGAFFAFFFVFFFAFLAAARAFFLFARERFYLFDGSFGTCTRGRHAH